MAKPLRKKVQVWIRADEYFLLLKTNPDRGGFWQPVTGSVEKGESIEAAAERELQEETGFYQTPEPIGSSFKFEDRFREGGEVEEHGFWVDLPGPLEPELDGKEHEGFQWVTAEKAFTLLRYPSNVEMLKSLRQAIKKSKS